MEKKNTLSESDTSMTAQIAIALVACFFWLWLISWTSGHLAESFQYSSKLSSVALFEPVDLDIQKRSAIYQASLPACAL